MRRPELELDEELSPGEICDGETPPEEGAILGGQQRGACLACGRPLYWLKWGRPPKFCKRPHCQRTRRDGTKRDRYTTVRCAHCHGTGRVRKSPLSQKDAPLEPPRRPRKMRFRGG